MATYAQTPGLLNIKGVVGAHFSCQLDFATSLVGYTFDSAIVLQEYPTKREQAITITVDNAAQGIIKLSLTQGQTTTLGAIANKKWYLNWTIGGIKQTILAGTFELSDIPLGQNIVTSTGVTINTQNVDITLSAFSNAALDGKQPLDADLTAISNLSPNDNDLLQRKSGSWTNRSIAQIKTDLAISNVDNTSDLNKPISTATQSALNAKLDSTVAASSYQPLDSDLTSIAGITPSNDDIIQRKAGAWTNRSIAQVKTDLSISNVDNTSDLNKPLSTASINEFSYKVNTNQISAFGYTLVDDIDAPSARTTLGLGTAATQSSNSFQPIDSDLTAIAGLSPTNDDFLQRKSGNWENRSIAQVKTDLGVSNVDNTSDLNKPISTVTQSALNNKLDSTLASASYQPLDSDLTSIAGITPSNDDIIQRKAGAWTSRSLLEYKTDLALNNVDNTSDANKPISTATQSALNNKLDTSAASATYQPLDGDLTAIAVITPNDDDIIQRKSGSWTNRSLLQYKTDLALNNVNNTSDTDKPLSNATINALSYKVNTNQISSFGYTLIDDVDAASSRSTLGLGTMSVQNFSPAQGGVLYSGFGTVETSSIGTIGQVLTSTGVGAPAWSSLSNLQVGTAAEIIVADNNTANREFFPVFAYQTGAGSQVYGSSTKLKFNPSNGYFTTDGGFFANGGDLGVYSSGVHWGGALVFSAEETNINDLSGNLVATWGGGSGNGLMHVTGTASKDLPLRLMNNEAVNLATGAYIIVRPSASATTNGTELRNAYAAAKAFTPNTAALSATNRATVILLPGRYDLGTTRLNLDTDFVDIIGLTDTPEQVVITSQVILSDSGTIYQTANDVKIKGVTIDRTGAPAGSGAGRTAAYFPFPKATAITSWSGDGTTMTIAANGHGLQTGDSVRISGSGNSSVDGVFTVTRIDDNSFSYPSTVNAAGSIGTATERFNLTYIENCVFSGDSGSGMRIGMEYSGTYRRCAGGTSSFGGTLLGNPSTTAIASGLFEDCTAGAESFGGSGTASGTFTRCTSSGSGFGGTASGTFTDCSSSTGFTFPSGTFVRCSVATSGFGSAFGGSATGTFTDCTINNGAYNGTFTGTARRCRFVASGGSALSVGSNAKLFDSTLVSSGVNNSITAGSAVTISLAGCRMNNSINANVSNNLGTLTESYNLIDSDIN
jgi:uncharacterized protein (UPF0303 family)